MHSSPRPEARLVSAVVEALTPPAPVSSVSVG